MVLEKYRLLFQVDPFEKTQKTGAVKRLRVFLYHCLPYVSDNMRSTDGAVALLMAARTSAAAEMDRGENSASDEVFEPFNNIDNPREIGEQLIASVALQTRTRGRISTAGVKITIQPEPANRAHICVTERSYG